MSISEIIKSIPKDFTFGTATSSYQIEGSAFGGCGESHWDSFARQRHATYLNQNGSIACNHFDHWKEDLDLIRAAGFSAYRFSFSWPRILPDGKKAVNSSGIDFYDRLIDGLLERDILPFATLYHWDLPQTLAEIGGWTNTETSDWFGSYAELVMKYFGNRLHSIATVNEPWCVSWLSHYIGEHAPGKKNFAAAVRSMHIILKAHGKACTAIRAMGHKNIGIVLNKQYMMPQVNAELDISACNLSDEIHNLWFDEAIFNGKYPRETLKLFNKHMPKNFDSDLEEISQRLDWIGINYYTRSLVRASEEEKTLGFKTVNGQLEKTDMGWEVFPEGLSFLIKRLSKEYSGSLPIYITENGMANKDEIINGRVKDDKRIEYFELHLKELKTLIDAGYPLRGYFTWSLLDNFEWAFGYSKRFGLVYVDFDNQERLPKASYHAFAKALLS
ncbi:MAG: GH1 family beta-glucosidase [Pseudomonadota bacterium]|nr:GH1 family beta-glucosidase [Pseudomonadota bacterium]